MHVPNILWLTVEEPYCLYKQKILCKIGKYSIIKFKFLFLVMGSNNWIVIRYNFNGIFLQKKFACRLGILIRGIHSKHNIHVRRSFPLCLKKYNTKNNITKTCFYHIPKIKINKQNCCYLYTYYIIYIAIWSSIKFLWVYFLLCTYLPYFPSYSNLE